MLQGVYQSNQATAAACQVNNIHLIRGMIGRPGCGVLPDERPADRAEHPRDRRRRRPARLPQLGQPRRTSQSWPSSGTSTRSTIPHWAPPTHAMQIFRYAEQGSIKLLWISRHQPGRVAAGAGRASGASSSKAELFVVVQDAFLTETAQLADVVLPAAIWGEKTGTFTNVDRTVHISHKAVEPPGEARSDLDIFLDYARRMDFRDKDGAPLIKWHDPEGAFEAWKACSRGRPCDYSGLTYAKLRGGSGIQWPCNDEHPDGTERLYTDGVVQHRPPTTARPTATTWSPARTITAEEYRAKRPARPGLPASRASTSRRPRSRTTTTRCC